LLNYTISTKLSGLTQTPIGVGKSLWS